jgi:hypothetical protein
VGEVSMTVIANTFGGKVMWSSASQFEVAEGLVVVVLVLLVVVLESRGMVSLFRYPILSKHLKSPLSRVFTVLAAVGALSYALLVMDNMKQLNHILDVGGLDIVQYPLRIFGFFGGSAMGQNGTAGYGALAFLIWGLTIVSLSLARGFTGAVKLFAIPSILFLTVVVFLFDPGEMASQAVNVVSGITYNGTSLLSNWFLLTVSLALVVFDLMYRRLQRKRVVRSGLVVVKSDGVT